MRFKIYLYQFKLIEYLTFEIQSHKNAFKNKMNQIIFINE